MKLRLMTTLVALASCGQALAGDEPPVRFSGFGTLGVLRSNGHDADYVLNIEQRYGSGLTNTLDSSLDTKFALQADATLASGLTATAQLMSRRHSDNTSRAEFEWLNLRYQTQFGMYLRGGRVQTPMFMLADFQNVGYALTPLRVPAEVYSQNILTHLDGADIGYRKRLGELMLGSKVLAGKRKLSLQSNGGANFEFDIAMATLSGEFHGSTLRSAYARFKIHSQADNYTLLSNSLATLAANNIPNAATAQGNLQLDGNNASFLTFGYGYDKDKVLLLSEYSISKADGNAYMNKDAWYLLGGYRLGQFIPYVSHARLKTTEQFNLPLINVAGTPTALQRAAGTVNSFINDFTTKQDQNTWSIGCRWDALDNIALKLQADRVAKPAGSKGNFNNATPSFIAEKHNVSVISASIDFTF